ncbi:hypothetical protein BDZ91DRAFT_821004 [Kalaharituber pfeilii]|nr:hypothetical protein BDZ91DRAFT_821004 [Kalaharituber pfeilii]
MEYHRRGKVLSGSLLFHTKLARVEAATDKTQVGYIWRGTFGSYILLVWSYLRRRSYNLITTFVCVFLIGSVLSRLSVGLLGLTYTLDFDYQVKTKALRVVEWPENAQPMTGDIELQGKNASSAVIVSVMHSIETLLTLLRRVVDRITPQRTLELNDTQLGGLANYSLSILNEPGLALSVNELTNTVSYTYHLKDDGEEEHIKESRAIQTMATCITGLGDSYKPTDYASSRFYPFHIAVLREDIGTSTQPVVFTTHPSGEVATDIDFSTTTTLTSVDSKPLHHPGNWDDTDNFHEDTSDDGMPMPGRRILSAADVLLGRQYNEYGVKYKCQITVNYHSPVQWDKQPGVTPSAALLQTLSGFLVGNESRQDVLNNRLPETVNRRSDKLWLPLWEKDALEKPLAGGMIAGALARAVALVVQRMGQGLSTKEIEPSTYLPVARLYVKWWRVWAVLGGVAGLQIFLVLLASWVVFGTLVVKDNVKSINSILKDEIFQEGKESGRPWEVAGLSRQGDVVYRFTGVIKEGQQTGRLLS